MLTDLRLAVRTLRAQPVFALVAVLTLALGIGANTLVFSAVRGLLVRELPFADAGRLVWVYGSEGSDGGNGEDAAAPGGRGPLSRNEARALTEGGAAGALVSVAAFGDRIEYVRAGERPARWDGLDVTPGLFAVLGVAPALGRVPESADLRGDSAGGARLLFLGHDRWRREFAGDRAVVGRALAMGTSTYTIAGVLPAGLEFPLGRAPQGGSGSGFRLGAQDFWIVQGTAAHRGGTVVARLRPGATPTTAAGAVRAALRGVAPDATGDGASQPGAPPPRAAPRAYELVALRDQLLGPVGPALRLLQGFAALVLVIACANLANLLLARVSAREREFAVRAALGAGRAAVGRVVLAEGALLAAGGGAAGVLVAAWGLRALRTLAAGPVPLVERVALDGPTLLFTLGVCAATTLAFGVAPALHAAAPGAGAALRAGRGEAGTAGAARLRRALAVGQMALALVLLFGAALLLQSLARALTADNAGYEAARVVAADVALPGHPDERGVYARLVARVRALPGVEAVGAIQSTPLTGKWTFREPLAMTAGQDASALAAPGSLVAFDYFRAMGVAVLDGRAFGDEDVVREDAGRARTVILNRTAARRLNPGASLLGRTVYVNGKPRTVVGVVEDTRDLRLDAPAEPRWYAPAYFGTSQLVVRTAGDPARAAAAVRAALLAADPGVVVGRVEPLGDIAAASVAERRVTARLLATFAAVALALAVVGLYGVVSFGTARRRREFGVRTALGARPADVRRLVLGEGLKLSAWGIGAGLLAAVPAGLLLRGLLFGVSPADPATLAAVCGVLAASALAASWAPARRAARLDPSRVLRAE